VNPDSISGVVVAAILTGLASSAITILGTWKLYGWRIRVLEERMLPVDRAEDSVLIRLTRLESRRRVH